MMKRSALRLLTLLFLVCALLLGSAAAQADAGGDDAAVPASEAEIGGEDEAAAGEQFGVENEVTLVENDLGIASVGISAGFPAYQSYALNASVQYQFFGMALRGTWTPAAGFYGAVAVRGYPPIPGSPVPMFAEVGVGGHQAGATMFAAVGGHVPLATNIRLDFELGAARVPFLNEYNIVPFLSVGASYAFTFEASSGGGDGIAGSAWEREAVPTCPEPRDPDPAQLREAIGATVLQFVREIQATYSSLYSNISYSWDITSSSVDGDRANVTISYSGSATEIASGERVSGSGTASGTFRWNGCGWANTGVEY